MSLRVVAPFGSGAASVRCRVLDWLDVTGAPAEIFRYANTRNAAPSTLLRSAGAVIRAEILLRRVHQPVDVVLMHLGASPFSRGSLEEQLLHSGRRRVVDFDDAVQYAWRPGLRGVIRQPGAFLRMVHASDTVIAGNDALADWASETCRDVVVVPTCIDTNAYEPKTGFDIGDPPRLGWIGSPSTERYLRLVEQPLLELHRRFGAVLVVMSGGATSLGALDAIVTRVPWSQTAERQLGSLMDVGIMPLDDSLWSRGKCGYKLLQYAAAGTPAVASPWGANGPIAASLGFEVARTETDWVDAVSSLLTTSAASRAEVGEFARNQVANLFSYDVWRPTWTRIVLGSNGVGT